MYPKLMLCGEYGPYSMNKLRSVLQKNLVRVFGEEELTAGQNILVIKRSGKKRSIVNYDEMLSALKAKFPEENIVEFSDDPVPSMNDILRMFYEAKLIVSPHGAGLTNLFMCNEGVGVIEMLPRVSVECFRKMSQLLKLRYEGLVVRNSTTNDYPITVDVDAVVTIAQRRLAEHYNDRILKLPA
eukprot:TRINITY_DN117_c0_g1_i1.p1 TRINITY_DN117_c0_g1~~TRINITY_DN117_c0_g1_i1.p1  ORF type:complete len:184 (-),score=53.63 TRINITY_DN117_c0_g1_i1:82-633(-)